MKTMKQKTLMFIALLAGLFTIISCEEENEVNFKNASSSAPIEQSATATNTKAISNGLLKERLIQYAYEAYANGYDVELTPENTTVIDKATLQAWVEANETNKHQAINQKNRAALTEMAQQGEVYTLLVKAPAGSPFQQSVFVLGKFTAVVITDIRDLTDPGSIWPKLVKVGVGFYGDGFYDPFGNYIPCICVEEYKIVHSSEYITKCGRCPDDL